MSIEFLSDITEETFCLLVVLARHRGCGGVGGGGVGGGVGGDGAITTGWWCNHAFVYSGISHLGTTISHDSGLITSCQDYYFYSNLQRAVPLFKSGTV